MKNISLIMVLIAFSCGQQEEEKTDGGPSTEETISNQESAIDVFTVEGAERALYVDDDIAGHLEVEVEKSSGLASDAVFVVQDGSRYQILNNSGMLTNASGDPEGFSLKIEPYTYYDEMEDMDVTIGNAEMRFIWTRDQNNSRKLVDYTDVSNSINLEYFENILEISYYQKDGKNYPVKIYDTGKAEWDG